MTLVQTERPILMSFPHSRYEAEISYGWSEYSYRYLANALRNFLDRKQIQYQIVHSLSELEESAFRFNKQAGKPPIHLSVAPPHETLHSPLVKTFAFFAWEFEDIPSLDVNENPRFNWARNLSNVSEIFVLNTLNIESVTHATSRSDIHLIPNSVIGCFDNLLNLDRTEDFDFEVLTGINSNSHTIISKDWVSRLRELYRMQRIIEFDIRKKILISNLVTIIQHKYNRLFAIFKAKSNTEIQFISERFTDFKSNRLLISTWANVNDERRNLDFIFHQVCLAAKKNSISLLLKIHGNTEDASKIIQKFNHISEKYEHSDVRFGVVVKYLNLNQHVSLRKHTDLYLNASFGEGLCLPVIEHLILGVPCLMPKNTAFLDFPEYPWGGKAKVDRVPTYFPFDRSKLLRTFYYPPLFDDYAFKLSKVIDDLINGIVDRELIAKITSDFLNDSSREAHFLTLMKS